MVPDLDNLPTYIPATGIVIIGFTTEQVKTYNVRFGIEIVDTFHPDEHSIEEATVIFTSPKQRRLQPGQNILVDYSVFTAGRHRQFEVANVARFLTKNDDWWLYWCYDDQHPQNSAEVFGIIDDKGKVKAFGDCVIIYPHEEQEVLIEIMQSMDDVNTRLPGGSWALVYDSQVEEIEAGELILCEKGLSPKIRFRGIEMQYINYPYILGKASKDHPFHIKLF